MTNKRIKKQLEKAPDTKDLSIQERFDKIFERDNRKRNNVLDPFDRRNDDDDYDSPPGLPGPPPPPPMDFDFNFDREDTNPFNLDLNNLEQDCYNRDIPVDDATLEKQKYFPQSINLDRNLREIFPDADDALNLDDRQNIYNDFADQLDRDKIPEELEFFSGGSEQARSLFSKLDSFKLIDRGNEDFVNYLATEECQDALERDGISIHIPTRNIFINNENTGESLYTFLNNQQDETKKEIPLDFTYDDDLTDNITKYLPAINEVDEVKYDFTTNKSSKFLFNLFNKYLENRGRQKYQIRHSTTTTDNYALQTLQD